MSDVGDAPTGVYTTPTDVRLILAPDGSPADTGSAAGLDDATLAGSIAEATTEVEARLAGRYTVPFAAPIPAVITSVTSSIAAYLATMTYRRGAPIMPTDPVYLRYMRAEQLLRDLSVGNAIIDIGGVEPGTTQATVVNPYIGSLFRPHDFDLSYDPFGGWENRGF